LEARAGCLAEALLKRSGASPAELGDLNRRMKGLRDAIYESLREGRAPKG